MVDGIMSEDVQPGKKANTELKYYSSVFKENGIDVIDNLEFFFHMFDEKTWDTIDDSEIIRINP